MMHRAGFSSSLEAWGSHGFECKNSILKAPADGPRTQRKIAPLSGLRKYSGFVANLPPVILTTMVWVLLTWPKHVTPIPINVTRLNSRGLLRNSRKTECGADKLLVGLVVHPAPCALFMVLFESARTRDLFSGPRNHVSMLLQKRSSLYQNNRPAWPAHLCAYL